MDPGRCRNCIYCEKYNQNSSRSAFDYRIYPAFNGQNDEKPDNPAVEQGKSNKPVSPRAGLVCSTGVWSRHGCGNHFSSGCSFAGQACLPVLFK